MKPELQKTKIANACGWKLRNHCKGYYREGYEGWIEELPDYLNDLNAMHEAEKIFADDDLFRGYEAQLDKVVPMSERWIFATAAQRAEAFLRTLNLWEESP